MATASYTLLIDWTGTSNTFTSVGANVSTRVYSVECRTGKDFDSVLFGKPVAGRLSAVLNNQSGDYNSFKASGPLYGSLLPGRRMRLLTGSGNHLWMGYIESIVPGPSVDGNDTVIIQAVGPLGYVNQKIVQTGMHTTTDTGLAIKHIVNDTGWDGTPPSGGTQIDTGITIMKHFWTGTVRALEAMQMVEETEEGQLWETTNGEIGFTNRHFRLTTSRCTTSQATLSDASGATFTYSAIHQEDPIRYLYNEIKAVFNPTTVDQIRTTLWRLYEGSHNNLSPIIPAGGTIDIWTRFPNRFSTAQGVGVENWYMPSMGTVLVGQFWVNSQPDGLGENMSSLMSTAATDYGNRARIRLTNTSGKDGYLTRMEVVGDPVVIQDPTEVVLQDTTSQDKFGIRTYILPSQFYPDRVEAEAACRRKIDILRNPMPLITVTIRANRTTAHLDQVCKRQIQDRVTLIATGSAGLGIAEDFFIESIQHQINQHRTHITQWQLVPVIVAGTSTSSTGTGSGTTAYWILGSGSLDTQTKLS